MPYRSTEPFETRPPRLKDLVNQHVMGDVWIRDTPFGPVTDTLYRSYPPFEKRPPRLKDLVDQRVMGDVWLRDTPFGPVTDSIVLVRRFNIRHDNVLRSIDKCIAELGYQEKYELINNLCN